MLFVDLIQWRGGGIATYLTDFTRNLSPQRQEPAVICVKTGCRGPLHLSPNARESRVLHLGLFLHILAIACVTLKCFWSLF